MRGPRLTKAAVYDRKQWSKHTSFLSTRAGVHVQIPGYTPLVKVNMAPPRLKLVLRAKSFKRSKSAPPTAGSDADADS